MPDLGHCPLVWCGRFLPIHKRAIQISILFNDLPTPRAFKPTRPLASGNILSAKNWNVYPIWGTALCSGAVDSYLFTNGRSKFQFYSMTHQHSERLNQRDPWPPGKYFPPGKGMYARPVALPSALLRLILTYSQTGDPNFNSIQ